MMHRIYPHDVRQREVLQPESVDLIVTSPPYNLGKYGEGSDDLDMNEYYKFSLEWLQNCHYWTRPTGRLCLNVPTEINLKERNPLSANLVQIAQAAGWIFRCFIIWDKKNVSRRTAFGSWQSASAPNVTAPVEFIIVFYKWPTWKRQNQGANDITKEEFLAWTLGSWQIHPESAKRIGHPCPFPRELARRCIKMFSFVGDTVLDPFCGSGTTIIEAINHNRTAIGIEISTEYCQLAEGRVREEALKQKHLQAKQSPDS